MGQSDYYDGAPLLTSVSSVINVDHLFGETARSLVIVSTTSLRSGSVSIATTFIFSFADMVLRAVRSKRPCSQ
jgi:hypothetical protein